MNFAMGQMSPPPRAAAAEYFPMTPEAGGRLAAGGRPTGLVEPRGPQERVLRHTVEHIVDLSPFVQILDVPVQQVVDQLVDLMKHFDTQSPVEQDIAVPKISLDRIPQSFVDRCRPQMAEQLVDVPTVVSYSSLQQQSAEQNVDIPVPGTRGDHQGLRGFHPRQGSQRTVGQIVDKPVHGGRPQGFLPDPGLAARSAVSRDELGQRVFRTFPRSKKSAEVSGQSSARVHAHSSSSELSAHQMPARDDLWVQINIDDDRTYYWNRQERTSHWDMPLGIRSGCVRMNDGLFVHIDTRNVLTSIADML